MRRLPADTNALELVETIEVKSLIEGWLDAEPPANKSDIDRLEAHIGGKLPDDYKDFLMTVNARMTIPELGLLHKASDATWIDQIVFIPYNKDKEKGLMHSCSRLREADIGGFAYIAISAGKAICLDCVTNVGSICMTNHQYEHGFACYSKPMTFVASSFSELLSLLIPVPQETCPIRDLGLKGTPEQLEEFLAAGNSIDTKSIADMTIIRHAVAGQNMGVFERCIQRGANLKGTLCHAVMVRNIPMIHRLIEAGLDLNQDQLREGEYPLDHVSGCGLPGEEGRRNREVRDLLLRLGATKSKYGYHNKLIKPVE